MCAGVGVAASFLNAYNVFKGPGTDTVLPPAYYTYFGMFMAFAFGLGFVAAPEFLSRMKTKVDAFDGTHLFDGRFIGCNMVVFGITLAFILDTAGAFKATGVWMTLAVLFGPTYACIAMDPVMTPDGVAGDRRLGLQNICAGPREVQLEVGLPAGELHGGAEARGAGLGGELVVLDERAGGGG